MVQCIITIFSHENVYYYYVISNSINYYLFLVCIIIILIQQCAGLSTTQNRVMKIGPISFVALLWFYHRLRLHGLLTL